MNSTPDKTPSKEEQLRQLVASYRRNAEDTIARSKILADKIDGFLNDLAVEQEELRPEDRATFATILSPLETLDVKRVVSKGDNIVNPAEDDQLPENLESKMDTSVDHSEPARMGMMPTMAEKGRSRHGAGSVNATMSVQDGVLRGSSRDAGRHQSAHSATAMSLLEAVLVKGVASGEPEMARDFVVAAVFADGYPRGSVGAMKHMHDRWKWKWKIKVQPNL